MKRVLAIWLPNWPLQRLVSKRPELKGRQVILESTSSKGKHVAACSAAAFHRGVRTGMPSAEAVALAGLDNHHTGHHDNAQSALHRELHYPLEDRKGLEKLADWCHRFSPTVGIEDSPSSETLLLDLTNLAPLFGSEEALVGQVEQGIKRLHLKAHLGLADNIATAWAVAHYGLELTDGLLTIVPAGNGPFALELLPVAALRLPDDVLLILCRLGVEQIGMLLSLPRDQLLSRFGPLLLKRINQALGHEQEVFKAVYSSPDFSAQWLLEHPLSKRIMVEQVIKQLVHQIVQMLSAQDKGALQLVCHLECESATHVSLEAKLFRPSNDAAHILEIISMQTEKLLLPGPVNAVKVCVTRYAPITRRQRLLFEQGMSWHNSSHLISLVDRLVGRLGRRAVVRCRLKDDAQPEFAFCEEPLVSDAGAKKKVVSKRLALAPLDRPLHFFTQPILLQALTLAPEGIPIRFLLRGRQYDVARLLGPERIETGWWRKRGVRRDYYRVETTAGKRFWLFRCLRRRRWFLHGTFD